MVSTRIGERNLFGYFGGSTSWNLIGEYNLGIRSGMSSLTGISLVLSRGDDMGKGITEGGGRRGGGNAWIRSADILGSSSGWVYKKERRAELMESP